VGWSSQGMTLGQKNNLLLRLAGGGFAAHPEGERASPTLWAGTD